MVTTCKPFIRDRLIPEQGVNSGVQKRTLLRSRRQTSKSLNWRQLSCDKPRYTPESTKAVASPRNQLNLLDGWFIRVEWRVLIARKGDDSGKVPVQVDFQLPPVIRLQLDPIYEGAQNICCLRSTPPCSTRERGSRRGHQCAFPPPRWLVTQRRRFTRSNRLSIFCRQSQWLRAGRAPHAGGRAAGPRCRRGPRRGRGGRPERRCGVLRQTWPGIREISIAAACCAHEPASSSGSAAAHDRPGSPSTHGCAFGTAGSVFIRAGHSAWICDLAGLKQGPRKVAHA